jgi:hypothetical protein
MKNEYYYVTGICSLIGLSLRRARRQGFGRRGRTLRRPVIPLSNNSHGSTECTEIFTMFLIIVPEFRVSVANKNICGH